VSVQISKVFKVYSESGTKLCVELPEELVEQIDVHENDTVHIEYTESCYDTGEYHGIILSFKEKGKLNG